MMINHLRDHEVVIQPSHLVREKREKYLKLLFPHREEVRERNMKLLFKMDEREHEQHK